MDILEILGRIGFDPKMALFSVINFLIVLLILKKFLFDAIGKTITERQNFITEGIENAQKAKIELSQAESNAQEIIKEAKKSGGEIVKKYQEDAVKVSESMKAKTQDEIDQMYQKSKEQIEAEKAKSLESLKEETAELAIKASEMILKKKLDGSEDKKIINEFLGQINTK